MLVKWIGFFVFIINVVLNFIVNCDEIGDGIVEFVEMGDFMKLESGDFIGVEVFEDGFCKLEGDVILLI